MQILLQLELPKVGIEIIISKDDKNLAHPFGVLQWDTDANDMIELRNFKTLDLCLTYAMKIMKAGIV